TQPTLTQVPPTGPDSTSATRAPWRAARIAVAMPAEPAPRITMSCVVITRSVHPRCISRLLPQAPDPIAAWSGGRARPRGAPSGETRRIERPRIDRRRPAGEDRGDQHAGRGRHADAEHAM